MLTITINSAFWSTIKEGVLNSRSHFDYEMFKLVFEEMEPVFEDDVNISFPGILTKKDRWRIHTYSEKNMVSSISEDIFGERVITCTLSKEYVKEIYNIYKITNEPEPVVDMSLRRFNEFKKSILDDIMSIVDKHLTEEYLKYYI